MIKTFQSSYQVFVLRLNIYTCGLKMSAKKIYIDFEQIFYPTMVLKVSKLEQKLQISIYLSYSVVFNSFWIKLGLLPLCAYLLLWQAKLFHLFLPTFKRKTSRARAEKKSNNSCAKTKLLSVQTPKVTSNCTKSFQSSR